MGISNRPAPGVTTNVSCPCSLVGVNVVPAVPDASDVNATEVGAKFYSDVDGTIGALRFYKAAKNTGTHVGSVWSMTGQRLATATFSGESATGWQTATLSPALAVTANTMYVVSYFAPAGHYTQDTGFSITIRPRLPRETEAPTVPRCISRAASRAPRMASTATVQSSAFPDQIYDAEYYWVDAVFNPAGSPRAGCFVGVAGG